jgi:hypothetical protein
MDSVSEAINEFYTAFSDVGAPKEIGGCECCLNGKEIEVLLSTPLHKLRPEDLSSYASSAFLTIGDIADYLYFLPRIIEISIRDDLWWPSMEVTARALKETDIPSWPANRRESLARLLHVVIDHMLETGEFSRLDEWLCAIGRMELDVQPYLEQIESSREAVLEYWKQNAGRLHEGKLGNAFWDPPTKGHDDIVRWLKSELVHKIYSEEYGYKI